MLHGWRRAAPTPIPSCSIRTVASRRAMATASSLLTCTREKERAAAVCGQAPAAGCITSAKNRLGATARGTASVCSSKPCLDRAVQQAGVQVAGDEARACWWGGQRKGRGRRLAGGRRQQHSQKLHPKCICTAAAPCSKALQALQARPRTPPCSSHQCPGSCGGRGCRQR